MEWGNTALMCLLFMALGSARQVQNREFPQAGWWQWEIGYCLIWGALASEQEALHRGMEVILQNWKSRLHR